MDPIVGFGAEWEGEGTERKGKRAVGQGGRGREGRWNRLELEASGYRG